MSQPSSSDQNPTSPSAPSSTLRRMRSMHYTSSTKKYELGRASEGAFKHFEYPSLHLLTLSLKHNPQKFTLPPTEELIQKAIKVIKSYVHNDLPMSGSFRLEEKVIFDMGNCFVKLGFDGDCHPLKSIPWFDTFLKPKLPQLENCFGLLTHDYWQLVDSLGGELVMEEIVFQCFYQLYNYHLLVDPKLRRVIFVENPLVPLPFKQLIAKVLFHRFQVPSITYFTSHVTSLLAVGATEGLVVDCGHLYISAMPVSDTRPQLSNLKYSLKAGNSICQRLREYLLEYATILPHQNKGQMPQFQLSKDLFSLSVLEDIKIRGLVVSNKMVPLDLKSDDRLEWYRNHSSMPSLRFPMAHPRDGTKFDIVIPGWIREFTCEVLFESGDEDHPSLIEATLDCLNSLSIDYLPQIIDKIYPIGGITRFPNFSLRFKLELLAQIRHFKRYQRLEPSLDQLEFLRQPSQICFNGDSLSWVGASICTQTKCNGVELGLDYFDGTVPDLSVMGTIPHHPSHSTASRYR
ncbi:actin-like ATPase domain-containing protein [Conidiobolus coronatus NRRL 28638]|uniref:Actin-like ATPase domain-containing protein n=1 Tax=Conidiobolus coronatus (strain ATCC 28846 / CBS 209.66 / NRRL 28638) TaxID=796925 RepID=A0A137P7K9_CONC2|nr:actin-like ATPase domain-containing protein [Conidiobolus coronatus NRRL 28638]|eukprot:KXN70996.1 actin-like ATPase domain-containing protein [Conidiobolus coronatus NRRL 28638]